MQDKSIIKQNILQYLDFIGSTPYRYYKETGTTRGVLTQMNGISEDNITRFLVHYPDINHEWLLTGVGDMLKSDSKPTVTSMPELKSFIKPEVPIKEIPLLPLDAVAGMGAGEFAVMEGDILQYYKVVDFKSADFMIPVKGSSMQPKYYGGDLLACRFIKTFSYFQWGVPHVITIKDKGTLVKRVFQCNEDNEIELKSDNENYPPFCIPKEDIVNISIVVGVIRLE